MNVHYINSAIAAEQFEPCVVALGDFDGIHVGHQQVIERARQMASGLALTLAVATLSPHPRTVTLQDERYHQLLTPLAEKISLLQELGVDTLFVIDFNREFLSMEPWRFITDYLLPMNVKGVVAGFDFRFGKGAEGTAHDLVNYGEQYGFHADIVEPVQREGLKVSSSQIRDWLSAGEMGHAATLLGRYYQFTGLVVEGDQRGRQLGFPTANLRLDDNYVLPMNGVYVVLARTQHGSDTLPGVMNIGTKPTFFENGQPSIEVHLLDYADNLYGQELEVKVLERIRDERKFGSVDELTEQLRLDVKHARERLLTLDQQPL
ncbi:MAG: ribC [Bacilli bacterium]|nr:ribC [Bacilli bacterium]